MSDHPDNLRIPGEYLLALVWFARRVGRTSGSPYLRCKFVVCAGSQKGKAFFTPWSLDLSKRGAAKRWELWMEQVGCEEEVDLQDDGAVRAVFLGKPFRAEVKVSTRNGYDNTDIDRLIYPRLYKGIDHSDIVEWNDEWASRSWSSQDPGADPGPAGDDRPPMPQSEPQWSKGSSFAEDDDETDLPF